MNLPPPPPGGWGLAAFKRPERRQVKPANWWPWCKPKAASEARKIELDDSEAPKLELQEAPPAAPASALPPSGAVPPWEREDAPEIEGDGLDELRAQIKAHEPMSREAKLEAARQELLQEEAYCLIQYDAAKKIGDRQEMDSAAESWKLCAGQLALLRQHPDKFVRRYGAFYDLK